MSRPVVLVTGGSAGIGAACVELAAQKGYDILLNYNSDLNGAEAARVSAEAHGARVILVQGDVSKPQDVDRIYDTLDAEFGVMHALINNAGIVGQKAQLVDMDYARIARMFEVNLLGAVMMAKGAAQRLRSGGSIINISSAAARLGSGNQYVDYAASKGAIDTFTKGLSDELAPQGVRVMAVRPGLIETDIHAKGGEPDRAERLAHMVPMQRTGSAMEIARSVLWLMSQDASYITGSALDVTGGR
ncbi:SDR family oxidoreductase [Ascidiaceihabitans sp.]|uniref:SDR family oxidoreductase n=1 Tax=Ascidiaceihabitans sp. TaxID=1872644 RepID=UPI0032973E22